uniref:NEFA-interacting nuclear protein NIP30 n=1 Tax=Caligus clemensi TaxID=344056 RepID=C1C3B2_CALCM|nr:NEFA-interacting nuclear protein NIP30 [Caligus clemensi]
MSSGFVSESDLEAARGRRQEEWDKVRSVTDPEEAPEPEYDSRSLFERLEANREKKQLEWEEAHKLKNQIRGIDDEEAQFLDKVSKDIENYEKRIENEELAEVQAYRLLQGRLNEEQEVKRVKSEIMVQVNQAKCSPKKSAQSNLLKAIVKRPSTSTSSASGANPAKRSKGSLQSKSESLNGSKVSPPPFNIKDESKTEASGKKGALLGIGDYGTSSEDEEDDN